MICQATDGAQQTTTRTFVVRVRDTTPPALQLPGSLQVAATSAQGARVTYAADRDGHRRSGAAASRARRRRRPISRWATTPVTCTGTDASGNPTQGGFTVTVAVSWSNLLSPINPLAVTAFLRGLPVAVQFAPRREQRRDHQPGGAPLHRAGGQLRQRRRGASRRGPGAGVDNLFRYVPLVGAIPRVAEHDGDAGRRLAATRRPGRRHSAHRPHQAALVAPACPCQVSEHGR